MITRSFFLLFVTAAITHAATATTITLTSSLNPAILGQSVTLTAAVLPSSATGRVTFYDGSSILGTPALVGGSATLSTALLPTGSHALKAYYSGDATFSPSSSTAVSQSVNFRPATGFLPPITTPTGAIPIALSSSDFNGDGKTDLAVLNQGDATVSILLGNADGTFRTAATYTVGFGPYGITAGDLNGDGKVDLVVANFSDNTVSIFLGNGDGTFQPPTTSPVGVEPITLAIADFNNDGKPDLVIGNFSGRNITVLLGKGDGSFASPVNIDALGQIYSLAAADFNGDGNTDVALATAGGLRVMLGNGNGTFQPPASLSPGIVTISVFVADFNGDGKPDIATANFSTQSVSVFQSKGDGTFQSPNTYPTGAGAQGVTAADFNGDGIPDLAVANRIDNTVSVLLGKGNGTFVTPINYHPGTAPYFLVAADFNGDGRTDLASANENGKNLSILLGGPPAAGPPIFLTSSALSATLGQSVKLTATIFPSSATGNIIFYDGLNILETEPLIAGAATFSTALLSSGLHSLKAAYTGDAVFPAVTSDPLSQLVTSNVANSFRAPLTAALTSAASYVALGDFNADGKPDLAFSGSDTISILAGNGDGTFRTPVSYTLTGAATIVTADFNGDGKSDLAVIATSGVNVLLGNGDGTFRSPVTIPSTAGLISLIVGDFNGDGKPDLAVNAGVFLGNGDGTFQALSASTFSASKVSAGDFNGDGKLDLVTLDQIFSFMGHLVGVNVWIRPGNGDGTFATGNSYSFGSVYGGVAVGDFNKDGKADLAVIDQSNNFMTILLGNGDGTLVIGPRYLISGRPTSIVTADLNGDGNLDLAVASPSGVDILAGNGDGTFQAAQTTAAGNSPGAIVIADFNADGFADLAVTNTSNAATILLGTLVGGPFPPKVAIDTPASGSTISGSVLISGWAIDNANAIGTAISTVQVKVDGTVVGAAAYGTSRPDVCAAYPGRPNCPNVGYSYLLNTSTLSTGTHVITISATDTDAIPDVGTATSSVTVSVSSVPPIASIDSPQPSALLTGIATVSGWALDNATTPTPIATVQVKVDGNLVGNATYGLPRPDACAVYTARPGCPNVGYTYALDTNSLSPGSHVITVSATDTDGTPDIGSKSVNVTVMAVPPSVYIETPIPGMSVSKTTVTGWAIDNGTPISSVVIKLDGAVVGTATYGASRPDVCNVFPGRPGCPNVGFTFALDTTPYPPGMHILSAVATDSDGNPDSATWSVAIKVISPPTVHIDSPLPGTTISGIVTISGWAVDKFTDVGTVQITVDGNIIGNATYGLPRPDVCAIYIGSLNCPNVGFTYQLNTALLSSGTHDITALVYNTNLSPDLGLQTIRLIVAGQPTVVIDSPPSGVRPLANITIFGWAMDNIGAVGTAISRMQAMVDGVVVGTPTYGLPRPDVCVAYPGRPGCPNVGYSYVLDISTVSSGLHTLTITATDSDATPDTGAASIVFTK